MNTARVLRWCPRTRFATAMLLLSCALASCQKNAEAGPTPEPPATSQKVALPQAQPAPPTRAGEVRVKVTGGEVRVTLKDGEAIKVALLASIEASDVEDKQHLLEWTRNAKPAISDGRMRIGKWRLGAEHGKLVLSYLLPSGPNTRRSYLASPRRLESGWVVDDLRKQLMRARR